jgi:hypothetical protein
MPRASMSTKQAFLQYLLLPLLLIVLGGVGFIASTEKKVYQRSCMKTCAAEGKRYSWVFVFPPFYEPACNCATKVQ